MDTTNSKKTEESEFSPPWRADSRPDPSVLTDEQRCTEFGRLVFRAIERHLSKQQE